MCWCRACCCMLLGLHVICACPACAVECCARCPPVDTILQHLCNELAHLTLKGQLRQLSVLVLANTGWRLAVAGELQAQINWHEQVWHTRLSETAGVAATDCFLSSAVCMHAWAPRCRSAGLSGFCALDWLWPTTHTIRGCAPSNVFGQAGPTN